MRKQKWNVKTPNLDMKMRLKTRGDMLIILFVVTVGLLLLWPYSYDVIAYALGIATPESRPRPRSEVRFSGQSIAFFVAAFGLVLVLAGAAILNILKKLLFMLRAEKIVGEVIDNVMSYNPIMYYPEFGFTTTKGVYQAFRSKTGSKHVRHQVGDKVTIYYDASQPEKVRVASFVDMWLMPVILLVFAGIILFFTISFLTTFLYYYTRR
jgi:Protein of unknown function (DUF3592)